MGFAEKRRIRQNWMSSGNLSAKQALASVLSMERPAHPSVAEIRPHVCPHHRSRREIVRVMSVNWVQEWVVEEESGSQLEHVLGNAL